MVGQQGSPCDVLKSSVLKSAGRVLLLRIASLRTLVCVLPSFPTKKTKTKKEGDNTGKKIDG